SGHFLVTELPILVAMRMEEEGLSKSIASDAVLRDNLFGLEIDARCTQIAAFNLALAAWKAAGYRALPTLNLACSGLGINARKEEWLKLANGDERLRRGMEELYHLFQQAPVLGSLINPKRIGGDLLIAHFHEIEPLFLKALARESTKTDENLMEMGVTAFGLAKAAEILAGQFTLVATNVPYLGRGKQEDVLKNYCESIHPDAKTDLATCFVERCIEFCAVCGTSVLVTPQNWFFLSTYKKLRQHLFSATEWNFAVKLGPAAFQNMNFWAAKTALCALSRRAADGNSLIIGLDVSETRDPSVKATLLLNSPLSAVPQVAQLKNPDARLLLSEMDNLPLLEKHGAAFQGIATADYSRFGRCFWELPNCSQEWQFQQSTVETTNYFSGREHIVFWEDGEGALAKNDQARIQGLEALGKFGIAVSQMNRLPVTLYTGEFFDNNCAALVVREKALWPAVWAYCSSDQFLADVRDIDQAVKVTNASLVKVPFDLAHWQKVSAEKYPHGLPKPFSSDPMQWLFNGHPKGSDQPLQVVMARLLGYQWPRQTGSSFPDCSALGPDGFEKLADDDGILCINPIKGEQPAAERLRALLAAAFRAEWTPGRQNELLEQAGFGGKTLEDWLRNGFFEQHCQLFHQRPFIWHIWDGRRDGFSALVNFHKLNRSNLEKLTYTFLGDWIARQKAANEAGEEGSDARLQAALELKSKLEKIIEGEAPYDIFVRWKPIDKQPIGWEPDLNDGVRLNIRPFVKAEILRKNPKINWNKDRGKDVASAPWYKVFKGERINDHHLTLEEKRKARGKS